MRSGLPGVDIVTNPHERNLSRDELLAMVGERCDGLLCTLADPLDAQTIAKFPAKLKVIATYAVGTNNIDLKVAKARGIIVANTPDVLTNASAEIAVGLMLACARRFIEGDRTTRAGEFTGWAPLMLLGRDLYGATVGIVGAGRIGQRVAKTLARGFDCRVLYTARSAKPEFERECGARRVELEPLLRESDFVSLHCPLTPETRHLIDAKRIALMKQTAYLINTARGPVVDEEALIDALEKRAIAGAGFDVYENEPRFSPRLAGLDNVVLLPHIGSATISTREAMGQLCAQAIVDALNGRTPINVIQI